MKTYNIREIGQIFDVPSSTLRYYEELGILPEVKRDEHKQRDHEKYIVDQMEKMQQDLDHIRQKVRFYNGIKKAIEKDEPWPCFDDFQ